MTLISRLEMLLTELLELFEFVGEDDNRIARRLVDRAKDYDYDEVIRLAQEIVEAMK